MQTAIIGRLGYCSFHTWYAIISDQVQAVCASCLCSRNTKAKSFCKEIYNNVNNPNNVVVLVMNFIMLALLYNHTLIQFVTGKILHSNYDNCLYRDI